MTYIIIHNFDSCESVSWLFLCSYLCHYYHRTMAFVVNFILSNSSAAASTQQLITLT